MARPGKLLLGSVRLTPATVLPGMLRHTSRTQTSLFWVSQRRVKVGLPAGPVGGVLDSAVPYSGLLNLAWDLG